MTWTSAVPEPRQADDGTWLCSTTGCPNAAVTQEAAPCNQCQDFARESSDAAAAADEQISDLEAKAQELIDTVRAEERDPTEAERAQLFGLLEPIAGLRAAAATHRKRAAAHRDPHTHPVFACSDHEETP